MRWQQSLCKEQSGFACCCVHGCDGCVSLQGLSKLMTEVLARYWSAPGNAVDIGSDTGPSSTLSQEAAYSQIGLPNQSQTNVHVTLLGIAYRTPSTSQDWQYFGQHAMPCVLATWIQHAQNGMQDFHLVDDEGFALPNMEFYVNALCESLYSVFVCSSAAPVLRLVAGKMPCTISKTQSGTKVES